MNKSYKRVIKFLTSYDKPSKVSVIGNEAVARGALEAGVKGVFSYPGTPSTEISEIFNQVNEFQIDSFQQQGASEMKADPIYFEYSINEKVALEKAIAYTLGNRPALCVMKNVGMNVASDALMTIAYQTIGAGLVIITCDDPGCHSSSNEQDSRYWGRMASVPVFDPSTPADAHNMAKDAFELSARVKLPVIIRMTTRVDHSRGMVSYGKVTYSKTKSEFSRSPIHVNVPARTAIAHQNLLDKLGCEEISSFHNIHSVSSSYSSSSQNEPKLGIITSGVATVYAKELLHSNGLEHQVGFLKLGLIHPVPELEILSFLRQGFSKVLILEELDPLIENEVRIIAQKNEIDLSIVGKDFAELSMVGEYNLDVVGQAISQFTGKKLDVADQFSGAEIEQFSVIPPRPPILCSGCPHRATYYALKLALHPNKSDVVLCGDIGCFGLGALPPLQMADTLHHMGMSVSMAQGLSEAFTDDDSQKKTIALVGDGTFFHSGIASLLNAIYTRANITVVIFDNRIIGMTGLQDNPGAAYRSKYRQIDLPALLKGMGVQYVETVDPFDVKDCFKKVDDGIRYDGVSVVISNSPCALLPGDQNTEHSNEKITVDHARCNTCYNQADTELNCSKVVTTDNGLSRARAKLAAKHHIPATQQSCPANICNHGFFNAILSRNYSEALELVRDKMLFAQICGDICHRPCEFLFREDQGSTIPIKKLKQFVSSGPHNTHDYSSAKKRTEQRKSKNNRVAIIGAGPAGLSSAYDLAQAGYAVTIFERESEAGGLLKFAIPNFRMDKAGCELEIRQLEDLGVTFKFNHSLGQEIQLEELSDEFEAVVIAMGMGISSSLDVVESTVPEAQRFSAIDFLRRYNQKTLILKPAAKILIIGGGNSALDAARAANRFSPANEVVISCLESRDKMPAFDDEVEEAVKEGIQIIPSSDVIDIGNSDNLKLNVKFNILSETDKNESHEYDYIITAIGQRGDLDSKSSDSLQTDSLGRIISNPEGSHTEYGNVFVAGDICAGNHNSLIGAIASGKNAAVGVRSLLEGYTYKYEGIEALKVLNHSNDFQQKPKPSIHEILEESYIKAEMPKFDLFQACAKCDHCIENFGCPALIKKNGQVEVDEILCTNCGLCIDVCINDAIHWVKKEAAIGELVEDAEL